MCNKFSVNQRLPFMTAELDSLPNLPVFFLLLKKKKKKDKKCRRFLLSILVL